VSWPIADGPPGVPVIENRIAATRRNVCTRVGSAIAGTA
jgi:hypothetical protein